MLWEIWDDIRQYIKMTFIPAMRNLFSSWRSLAGMFLVMLILQMLLSVICIFGVENIKNGQTVLDNFEKSLAAYGDTVVDSEGSFITSDSFKIALSGTSIFIGAVALWAACALAVYAKVTFAAADRDKYMWGMLVTNGAKKKKIRAMLKNELYLPHLVATAVAYPLSLMLCNMFLGELGYSFRHSIWALLIILVLSYICIRLVVAYEGLLIRSMSCVELLREEDAPKSSCFPRRHSRLRRGFTPLRYATATFIRMRKYYASLALIAALPILAWVCLQVSVTSSDAYLGEDINEFTLTLNEGISEEELHRISEKLPARIEGISSVRAYASYDAARLHTHLLLDVGHFSSTDTTPLVAATYADGTVKLCTNELGFRYKIGDNISGVAEGTVKIVCPAENSKYSIAPDTKIYLAVSPEGQINVVGNRGSFSEDFEYIPLTVTDVISLYSQDLRSGGYSNINDTYFVLNGKDYQRITSRSTEALSHEVAASDYTYIPTLDGKGRFSLTVPKTSFAQSVVAGDYIKVSGKVNGEVTLDADGERFEKELRNNSFDRAYVNSVDVGESTVTFNLTPYFILTLRKEEKRPNIVLGFGVPPSPSNEYQHYAETTSAMTLTGAEVRLFDGEIVLLKDSSVSGKDVGAYAILKQKQMSSLDGCTPLERLYADEGFRLNLANGDDGLTQGQARIVLPKSTYMELRAGDKIRISKTRENVLEYSEDAMASTNEFDALEEYISSNNFEYVTLRLSEVTYSDEVDEPQIYLCGEDFAAVINKPSPYTRLEIIIDPYIESEQYAKLRSELSLWSLTEKYECSIASSGEYLDYLIKKNSNYSAVISILLLLIPLIIPFIWYYPLASLFDRRRTELRTLEAMGKKKKSIAAAFGIECAMVSAFAFAAVLLLCMPSMLLFKTVCGLAALPLEFEYSYLSPAVLLAAGGISAACACVSFIVCYTTTSKGRIRKVRRNKHGNS